MIRKLRIAYPLMAMLVFVAVLADQASAETTLLAEWLANGAAIATNLNGEYSGSVKLEDTETVAGKAAVICSGIADGTVGANGLSETTKILNLKKEEIGVLGGLALLGEGAGSDCQAVSGCAEGSAASPIEVFPLGLPYKGELFLMENGEFLGLESAAEIGYEILCLILGINAEDKCTQTDGELPIENNSVTGDASSPSGSKATPKGTCTQSGKATGVVETTEGSVGKLESEELLTVSSL